MWRTLRGRSFRVFSGLTGAKPQSECQGQSVCSEFPSAPPLLSTEKHSMMLLKLRARSQIKEHNCLRTGEILYVASHVASCKCAGLVRKTSIRINPQLHIIWMLAFSVWTLDALPVFTRVFLWALHFPPAVQTFVNHTLFQMAHCDEC